MEVADWAQSVVDPRNAMASRPTREIFMALNYRRPRRTLSRHGKTDKREVWHTNRKPFRPRRPSRPGCSATSVSNHNPDSRLRLHRKLHLGRKLSQRGGAW